MGERARFVVFRHDHLRLRFGRLFVAENQMHQQADDNAEHDRADAARNPQTQAENAGGHDDCQHIDRGAGVEKGRRRAKPRAHAINSGKERQHGAGTDR